MAIYTGTWKDVDGVPFDPNGKVLHDQAGGGTACLRRTGISHHPQHDQLRKVQAYLRDYWFNVLTPTQKYWWCWPTPIGAIPRGGHLHTWGNGWTRFYSAHFAEVWRYGSIADTSEFSDYPHGTTMWISSVSVVAQTVTWNVNYGSDFGTDPFAQAALYQMKPGKEKTPTCWRDTRMLILNGIWDPVGGTFSQEVNVKWPLVQGRTVRFFERIRAAWWWKVWDSLSYPIPYP